MTDILTTYPINLPQNLLFIAYLETNMIFLVNNESKSSILPKELTGKINKYFQLQRKPIKGFCKETTLQVGNVEVEPRPPKPPWPPSRPPSPQEPPRPPPLCTPFDLQPMPLLFLLITSIITSLTVTRYVVLRIFCLLF